MELNKILSKQDLISLLEIIYSGLSCQDEDDVTELICQLKNVIPFEFAISLLVKMDSNGILKYDNYHILNINYPDEWIDLYMRRQFYKVDPIFTENFSKFKLQYWADTY
ncbi:MAG: autoinducer binding domain-containing protein, partial [bacterium]